MRLDGKKPLPSWLRGLEDIEARIEVIEKTLAALVAKPVPPAAPKPPPEKKAAPQAAPVQKVAAPPKRVKKKARSRKK
jgi:outer membrane protein TolC